MPEIVCVACGQQDPDGMVDTVVWVEDYTKNKAPCIEGRGQRHGKRLGYLCQTCRLTFKGHIRDAIKKFVQSWPLTVEPLPVGD